MTADHGSGRRVTPPGAAAALVRAKARLDPLELYDRPVSLDHVRIVSAPWLFRLPWFRRFDGYAMWSLILVRAPRLIDDEDLICHELCHVWQMQHHPLRMPLSYLRLGYESTPYEEQAREATSRTSEGSAPPDASAATLAARAPSDRQQNLPPGGQM